MTFAADEVVLERAARERAILLTADKDFGEMALARAVASPGIVLFGARSRIRPVQPLACSP